MAVAHVDRHAAGALMAALKKKIALTQLETVAPDQVRARARRGEVARWRGGDGRGGEGGDGSHSFAPQSASCLLL